MSCSSRFGFRLHTSLSGGTDNRIVTENFPPTLPLFLEGMGNGPWHVMQGIALAGASGGPRTGHGGIAGLIPGSVPHPAAGRGMFSRGPASEL